MLLLDTHAFIATAHQQRAAILSKDGMIARYPNIEIVWE